MHAATRWFALTLAVSVSSYLVSNAIPFFKALVGLIGALTRYTPFVWTTYTCKVVGFRFVRSATRWCFVIIPYSVPLSLTLPAILHRKANHIPPLLPDRSCASTDSYLLFLYSLAFLGIGLVGAISSIDEDWLKHGKPFSCR
jgi:hypothetical protein